MKLVFFSVTNHLFLNRDSFDECDTPQEIENLLADLWDEEIRIYDPMHFGWGAEPSPNLVDFMEDFNDEILDDGGWWCVVIPNETNEK